MTINIVNYSFLPNNRYHNVFHLNEDHSGIPLTNDIEIHMLELSKLDDQVIPIEGGLVNWLLFLKGPSKSNWEVLTMNEPVLRKVMNTLEFLSQDAEARRLYEMRQKALHDEVSMIEGAREEGEAKGREEGRYKKAIEVARKMLAKGKDMDEIVEFSGLTIEEVERLKAH